MWNNKKYTIIGKRFHDSKTLQIRLIFFCVHEVYVDTVPRAYFQLYLSNTILSEGVNVYFFTSIGYRDNSD